MNDTATHWYALQAKGSALPSQDRVLRLFGPSTWREASDQRRTAVCSAGVTDRVSAVFEAADRAQAELNAKFYLP